MLDSTATDQVSAFLSDFGDALAAGDIDRATAMFQDDCYWRDLVTFTWNIKTMEGRAEVADMLRHQLATTQAVGLADRRGRGRDRGRRRDHRLDQLRDRGGARLWPDPAEGRQDLDAADHDGRTEGP